jgi:hypothetical protein
VLYIYSAQVAAAAAVKVLEFPYAGATQSTLQAPGSGLEAGLLAYRLFNIGLGSEDLVAAEASGGWGSHFRVVAAPGGITNGTRLTWAVEGVRADASVAMTVTNLDADTAVALSTCAHLKIEAAPRSIVLGASAFVSLSTPFDTDFIVTAYNSLGARIPAPTVQMVAVEVMGFLLMSPAYSSQLLTLDQGYSDFLRRLGGGATVAMGNFSANREFWMLECALVFGGAGALTLVLYRCICVLP